MSLLKLKKKSNVTIALRVYKNGHIFIVSLY